MLKFPEHFLWGAATSAYQVEGGNDNSDWWPWEIKAGKEQSKEACQHFTRYEQDFDLARGLFHNAHRLSIEWARVEPKDGEFSKEAIEHYVRVVQALRRRGIEPVVTLHHFTNPIWLSEKGGWVNPAVVTKFVRYSEYVVKALAAEVKYWITINEPTIYVSHSFLWGFWPPQAKSIRQTYAVWEHMARGHIEVYRAIKKIYHQHHLPSPLVSISHHAQSIVACRDNLKNRVAQWIRNKVINYGIIERLQRHGTLDFIGLNFYSRQVIDVPNWHPGSLLLDVVKQPPESLERNYLGWEIYPQGLYDVLMGLKRFGLPVMITENGICTNEDSQRWRFIQNHLVSVHRAIQDGVLVTGYLHWSLLDNFEWDKGYGPRFGLIEVNYQTQERQVRESAKKMAEICRTNLMDLTKG